MYKPALSSVKYISPFGSTYTSVLFTPIGRGPGSTSDSENSATKYARELGTGPRRPTGVDLLVPRGAGCTGSRARPVRRPAAAREFQ
jgi:hypothetical protein